MTTKNSVRRVRLHASAAGAVCIALVGMGAQAQLVLATKQAEIRSDKLAAAPVVSSVPAQTPLRLISLEGGWAFVESPRGTGWMRAGLLDQHPPISAASLLPSGRVAYASGALALGIRALPPRSNRHALIIGISRYADPAIPALPGARIDRESATQMAQAMQVPLANIQYLQDEEATGANIRAALTQLAARVEEGDRVFIHYSGHGTRYKDAAAGGCVEALLAHDGGQRGTLTNREMANMLKSMTARTDKLFVMYDACYSGGLINQPEQMRSRGFSNTNDEGFLRPKFSSATEECGNPVNVKTRNLVVESSRQGVLPQDIIHISAARDNEVSFDDELKGGLATQFMRDCMLRDAKDLDGSGAITIEEIRQCAQEKVNKRMLNDLRFTAPNITLTGNIGFVPSWFSQSSVRPSTVVATALGAVSQPPLPDAPPALPAPQPVLDSVAAVPSVPPPVQAVIAVPVATPPSPIANSIYAAAQTPVPISPAPPPLTGAQALRQLFDQRDGKRLVQVKAGKEKLKIGQDVMTFTIASKKSGYVYVAIAGSDNSALQVLFPNALDTANRIQAGADLALPRSAWRIRAGGPAGRNTLLVMVTDEPRDLSSLPASGPFVTSLNDVDGRARLGALMTTSRSASMGECTPGAPRKPAACSDAYGAALFSVEEVQ